MTINYNLVHKNFSLGEVLLYNTGVFNSHRKKGCPTCISGTAQFYVVQIIMREYLKAQLSGT